MSNNAGNNTKPKAGNSTNTNLSDDSTNKYFNNVNASNKADSTVTSSPEPKYDFDMNENYPYEFQIHEIMAEKKKNGELADSEVVNWQPWYERMLHMVMAGYSSKEIADRMDKNPGTVSRVKNSTIFKLRLGFMYKGAEDTRLQQVSNAQLRLENEKNKLVELAFNMVYGYECENEGVRASLLRWLLEKFPEFLSQKDKAQAGVNNQVNVVVNQETLDRQKQVADDLKKTRQLLTKGNPYIVEDNKSDDKPVNKEDLVPDDIKPSIFYDRDLKDDD